MPVLLKPTRLLFAALLASCATPGPEDPWGDGSGGKEDGEGVGGLGFIQSNSPFYWADSTYPEFLESFRDLGGGSLPAPLAADHPLTRRLQTWADRLDAVVRAEVERSVGAPLVAPSPLVVVLPSGSTFNAWVSPVHACSGTAVGAAGPPDPAAGMTVLERDRATKRETATCARPSWPGAVELAAFWNRADPVCTLSAELTPDGTGCRVMGTPAGELALPSTARYVHLSTDLLEKLDEPTAVFVIAHELAHYYRGHVSPALLERYDFWYDVEPDRKKRPVPAEDAERLERLYREVVSGPRPLQPAVAGVYSARLRPFLLAGVVPVLAERTEPDFACAAARDAIGPWVSLVLHSDGAPAEAVDSYLDFEARLADCAPDLALGAEPGASEITMSSMIWAIWAHLPDASVTLRPYQPLAALLADLDERARHLDGQEASLRRDLDANRIGLYTTEQEADDLALDFVTRVGITPEAAQGAWLAFMAMVEAATPPEWASYYLEAAGGLDRAACQALLEAGFTRTDEGGHTVPVFVPIGELSEPHHSDCYRLFNLWRNAQVRDYRVAAPLEPLEPPWEELQAQAAELSLEAATRGE